MNVDGTGWKGGREGEARQTMSKEGVDKKVMEGGINGGKERTSIILDQKVHKCTYRYIRRYIGSER